jgi:hypothetical protein
MKAIIINDSNKKIATVEIPKHVFKTGSVGNYVAIKLTDRATKKTYQANLQFVEIHSKPNGHSSKPEPKNK